MGWPNMAHELQVLLIVSVCYLVGHIESKSCYAEENHKYKLFASKTAYDEIRGFTAREVNLPGCTAKQFYFLSRHGTRYPKAKDITKMLNRLPDIRDAILIAAANGKGKLCREDVENLKTWRLHINETADENLAPTGEQELEGMGTRFKSRFPAILRSSYKKEEVDVRVTNTERAESSAKHFLIGLYGNDAGSSIPLMDDTKLLRFYKTCPKWKEEVDNNNAAAAEATKFQQSSRMSEVLEDVSKRVGLKNQLTLADVSLMYEMCRFTVAWDLDKISPWCAAFKSDELKVLEYAEDLKYYYKHGYGHAVNYEQACPVTRDVIQHFKSKMAKVESEPNIVLRFSHSGMMLKLYARFGLFKDSKPLTADNFKKQKDRQWRTSNIDSFASNLAFVLLECNSEYKVVTYFQEREILLPECTSSPCSIDEFLSSYEGIADNCDTEKICKI